VDPDGSDIILLNRSYGAGGYGHNAVLIGDNENGWILYSKDDINKNTRQTYKNLSEFYEANASALYKDRYDRACWVTTTRSKDLLMQGVGDIIYNRKYGLQEGRDIITGQFKQNCADLVADIIKVNGYSVVIGKPKIQNGDLSRQGPYSWGIFYFENGNIKYFLGIIWDNITWPNGQFEDFARENSSYTFDLPKNDGW
jgi:hypothetical protein